MTAIEIQKLDYAKAGVRYTIHVEQAEGRGIWGTWNCHDCGIGGVSVKTCATADEAINAAKVDLDRHHVANHEA
jgi:hypothetical protein